MRAFFERIQMIRESADLYHMCVNGFVQSDGRMGRSSSLSGSAEG